MKITLSIIAGIAAVGVYFVVWFYLMSKDWFQLGLVMFCLVASVLGMVGLASWGIYSLVKP